jgi:hypothetical protein
MKTLKAKDEFNGVLYLCWCFFFSLALLIGNQLLVFVCTELSVLAMQRLIACSSLFRNCPNYICGKLVSSVFEMKGRTVAGGHLHLRRMCCFRRQDGDLFFPNVTPAF